MVHITIVTGFSSRAVKWNLKVTQKQVYVAVASKGSCWRQQRFRDYRPFHLGWLKHRGEELGIMYVVLICCNIKAKQ